MESMISQAGSEPLWEKLSPVLDEALADLGETDRQAVLLRFFENRSLAEVGNRLGLGEDSARKRVSRAVDKLRAFFVKRGVASSSALIAAAISAQAVQTVPVALEKSVALAALAKGGFVGASTLTLVKGALNIMVWTNAKTAVTAAVIVGLTTFSAIQHHQNRTLLRQNEQLRLRIDQLTPLTAENQRLSGRLAEIANSEGQMRTRVEGLLRRQHQPADPPAAAPALGVAPSTTAMDNARVPTDAWVDAGFGSPEATLKTRGWSVLNGDRQRFAQSVFITDGARKMIEDMLVHMAKASNDPDKDRLLQEALSNKWGAEEAILMPMMAQNQSRTFTGYQILSQVASSPDEMLLKVRTEMAAGKPSTENLRLQRFGDQWRIVIDEAEIRRQTGR
jgi:hypothetical protein